MAAFGRSWGAVKQADGSIKVEIVIQPEVASYLEEAAKTAGEPLTEHLQKCADEAFAMYFSQ
jgi:predicted amidohydrolase